MEAKEGSTLNITGNPTDFRIFSDSSESIILKHDGAFRGVIYAPYAPVEVRNNGDLLGAVWASTVEIKNSGNVYIDVAAIDKFPSNDIRILSWKDVRD